MSSPWIEHVRKRVKRWQRFGRNWVVAVSGGSDSVGLLRVLHQLAPDLGLTLSVAHFDHGARGEASRLDAEFVAELARTLHLPFDLGHWQPTRSAHFEADARRARYAWLAEIARARGASVVAVGHTRDDQAETVLHRILRGTGPRGLAGMPERRPLTDSVTLLRPLLKVSRQDIRAHLAVGSQRYREDATNADLSRTRARIRHDLLPRLAAEYNPRVSDALVRLGDLAGASDRAFRTWLLEQERAATVSADHHRVILFRDRLLRLPRFVRAEILRLAWRRAGWPELGMSAGRWQRFAVLVRTRQSRASVGSGVDFSADDSYVVLERSPGNASTQAGDELPSTAVPVNVPGATTWHRGQLVTTLDAECDCDEVVDFDRLIAPLRIRAPMPGDRFQPLGMEGESMALNDFFRGRRLSRDSRVRTPLLCDGDGIVWVVGHRIAHRVRLTENTERTLGLTWSDERTNTENSTRE